MLILMCGLPGCGKSLCVDILLEGIDADLVRPSDWMPDNIDQLGPDARREYGLACWKTAIDTTRDFIDACGDDDIIILDCGNSKYHTVAPIIKEAKKCGHRVVLLYVNASSDKCEDRLGDEWIGEDTASQYMRSIKKSLPKYKKACHKFLVVHNNSEPKDLRESVDTLRGKLCHPT